MKKDYYAEIIQEIRGLIETNPSEAAKKLEVELNMPYIPERYEAQFINLLEELKFKMKQQMNINNELSRDQVIDILMENNSVKMPLALAKLKDLNLRSVIDELHKIIAKESTPNMVKSIIYEYCIEQGINHDFEWNNKLINPQIVGSIITLKAYQTAYFYIEKNVLKNPSLQEVAKSFLELYSLNSFPNFIDEKEDLGSIIIDIAHESMGIPSFNQVDEKRKSEIKSFL